MDALPELIADLLSIEDHVADVAQRFAAATSAMFVGRVNGFPVALEGAQKLKEVSYVHAEAYPSAELKHGPLALIGPERPDRSSSHRTTTSSRRICRRSPRSSPGAVRSSPSATTESLATVADDVLLVPKSEPELDPLLLGIPLQLLAYHAALLRGVDIDQPRNLAKSVTVE